jgi:hypothetical protein
MCGNIKREIVHDSDVILFLAVPGSLRLMYTDVHNCPRVIALYVYYCERKKVGGRTWYSMSDLRLSGRHGHVGCNAGKGKVVPVLN